jgi:hypothetical protein
MLGMPSKWPSAFLFRFSLLRIRTFSLIYSVSLDAIELRLRLWVVTGNRHATLIGLGDVIVVFMRNM